MWLVRIALRRPITVLVVVFALVLGAGLALLRAPVDIFPNLHVPVIYVAEPYAGMAPDQMEGQFVQYYEYHFLFATGLEHIESQSIQGLGMLKLFFHPGTDMAQAMAQVVALADRARSFMPPGTLPAFILRFDAGAIPVGQLVFSSATRSSKEIQNLALYRVRPLLATLPGASSIPPWGGKIRTIVVYLDPDRLRSYSISPGDVAIALAHANLTLPTGNIGIGELTPMVATNAIVHDPHALGDVPLRLGSNPTVFVHDVARVVDGADIVYNVATVNGRPTVYMTVIKRADASTLTVVNEVKAALPQMRALVPPDVHINFEFDQSIYAKNAIRSLLLESLLGIGLTGLVVLLFLRDWRSALIVVLTIPFSLLAAFIALRLAGQTVNIMTLGGLALAVGILVDEGTIAIENIHVHLETAKSSARAVVDAMGEVIRPRFVAMLSVIAVFIPSFFMVGISRSLFAPLALAVAFAMIASYLLSNTLLPVFATWLLKPAGANRDGEALFGRMRRRYSTFLDWSIDHWVITLGTYGLFCLIALLMLSGLGTQLFPNVDTGQFQVRIRAPAGTRIERTQEIVREVGQIIQREVGVHFVRATLGNIGSAPWNYPVNAIFEFNSGPQDALLMVALRSGKRMSVPALEDRLRLKFKARFPHVHFSFEASDVVSRVLNLGSPNPIDVTVSGNDLTQTRAFTEQIMSRLKRLPMLRDVQIPQALDYPTIDVNINRVLAGQLGVTVKQVADSIVTASSSSQLIIPNFWTDPKTGIPYRISVQVPQHKLDSISELRNLPVMADGQLHPLVSDVATVNPGTAYGEFDHYNNQRMLSVVANVEGADLLGATDAVEHAIKSAGTPPRGTTVVLHGQAQQMLLTLVSLREGLVLAVVVVMMLLVANFQSLTDMLAVLSTIPGVLAGVVMILFLTGTTLNIESLIGAIMAIGVAVADSVLLISFARERREAGDEPRHAAIAASLARLRPVLMTGLTMIAGMIPMAIGLSESGQQTAPLGRAVIGGVLASLLTTLLVMRTVYVLITPEGAARQPSLDPDDPASTYFERGAR
ncbi:MAG: efflux RND transporter permease subunit [Candidatus Binataceae bacterium]|nr:efflux RND transporter permease subunit [Candidatus Binataceae bacterium]